MEKSGDTPDTSGGAGRPARKKKNPKKRWIKITVLAAVVVVLIGMFINLGNFLAVGEDPVKSDVIVVLAGDTGGRTAYAISLLKEGYADRLLFSGCAASTGAMVRQALDAGVPEDRLLIDTGSESTYDNAVNSRALLLENGYKSAIVVTSDYHMRRSRLVFEKAFKDADIRLVYCSSAAEGFTPAKWWANSHGFKTVCSEYIKLIGYFVQGKL
jgi:uncharacterized SAM-binding protein YcdF (DUF218 family)